MRVEQATAPIIIFGAPRSGTTYLNSILNEHPDVSITEESRLFVWMHQSLTVLPRREELLYAYREQFIEHLRSHIPDIIRSFYRGLDPTARYWGDKNPHYASEQNIGCLDTIAGAFAGTRFIHIIRDGRDVVNSLLRKGWTDFDSAHRAWNQHIRIGQEFGRRQPRDSYFELHYEELVANDPVAARSVFDFLGLSMSPEVEVYCREQQMWRTPLSDPERDLNFGGLGSDWGQTLSRDEQLRSLELLEEHLLALGYETEQSLSNLRKQIRLGVKTHRSEDTNRTSRHPEYQRVIDYTVEIVQKLIPLDTILLVVSKADDDLLQQFGDRRAWHFPRQADGTYDYVYPDDDGEAIAHVRALHVHGAQYIVFPATSLWWLDHYSGLREYLNSQCRVVWADARCAVYQL